jgi:hypothetical protein
VQFVFVPIDILKRTSVASGGRPRETRYGPHTVLTYHSTLNLRSTKTLELSQGLPLWGLGIGVHIHLIEYGPGFGICGLSEYLRDNVLQQLRSVMRVLPA